MDPLDFIGAYAAAARFGADVRLIFMPRLEWPDDEVAVMRAEEYT